MLDGVFRDDVDEGREGTEDDMWRLCEGFDTGRWENDFPSMGDDEWLVFWVRDDDCCWSFVGVFCLEEVDEVFSANSTFEDEDGDSGEWIFCWEDLVSPKFCASFEKESI